MGSDGSTPTGTAAKVYMKDPKEGDKLVFLNAGAYNFSSDFCDLEKLETEVVEDF
ncbi:hypothetical protein IIC68_03715 [archaeon]|nr:hypothetical protein [archaeon]